MGQRTENSTKQTTRNIFMSIDSRPINAATVPTLWPIPDINNQLVDEGKATVFIGIAFCGGYWQPPLHINCQPLFAFMKPQGVVQLTITTQVAINSAKSFQQKVELCFKELRDNFKV